MKQAFLAKFPFIWMAITGQVIFMGVFFLILVRVFLPHSQKLYQSLSTLPLGDENEKR